MSRAIIHSLSTLLRSLCFFTRITEAFVVGGHRGEEQCHDDREGKGKRLLTDTGSYHIKRSLLRRELSYSNTHTRCPEMSYHISNGDELVNCPADVFFYN